MYHLNAHSPAIEAPQAVGASCFGIGSDQRERRNKPRTAMVFTLAKITSNGSELPCMVRNLSETGIQIQLVEPPAIGSIVTIEMLGMAQKIARVCWAKGRVAGLRFNEPCSIGKVFRLRQQGPGSPSFRIERPGVLTIGHARLETLVIDVSTNGMRLMSSNLPDGQSGSVELWLGSKRLCLAGKILRRNKDYAFQFDQPLGSVTLAHALQTARA